MDCSTTKIPSFYNFFGTKRQYKLGLFGIIGLFCLILIFVRGQGFLASAQESPTSNIRGFIDSPKQDERIQGSFAIQGWAADLAAGPNNGPGVDAIYVFVGDACQAPDLALAQDRPTVSRTSVPPYLRVDESYTVSGYNIPIQEAPALGGDVMLTVCARRTVTEEILQVDQVAFYFSPVVFFVDNIATLETPQSPPFFIGGWAANPLAGENNGPGIENIRIVVGDDCEGQIAAEGPLDIARPDVVRYLNVDDSYRDSGYRLKIDFAPVAADRLVDFTACALLTGSDTYISSHRFQIYITDRNIFSGYLYVGSLILGFFWIAYIIRSKRLFPQPRQILKQVRGINPRIVLVLIVSLAPIHLVLLLINDYGVNVPYWEEWFISIPSILDRELTLSDLPDMWALASEHRIFAVRLISTLIHYFADHSYIVQMYYGVGLAGIGWLLLYLMYQHLNTNPASYIVLLPFALLIFSMAQWPRWIDTRAFTIWLGVVGFIGGMAALVIFPIGWRAILAAGALVYISSLSFFTGNIAWVLLFGVMWIVGYRKWYHYAAWAAMTASVGFPYVYDYFNSTPLARDSAAPTIKGIIEFTLAFVGSPLASTANIYDLSTSIVMGLLGVILGLLLIGYHIFSLQDGLKRVLPWATIFIWVLINGFLTSFGRTESFGAEAARSIRYMVYGVVFWSAIVALLVMVLLEARKTDMPTHQGFRFLQGATYPFAVIVLLIISLQYVQNGYSVVKNANFELYQSHLQRGHLCLLEFQEANDSCLERLVWNADLARKYGFRWAQYHVSFMHVDGYWLTPEFREQGRYIDVAWPETETFAPNYPFDQVLAQNANVPISWRVYIPNDPSATLEGVALFLPFNFNLDPATASVLAADYTLQIEPDEGEPQVVYNGTLSPQNGTISFDRFEVDLSPYADQTIRIVLLVDYENPIMASQVGWLYPRIVYDLEAN